MGTGAGTLPRGKRAERLLLAIGGQSVFACLVALVAGAPPAIEATIAFGLAIAVGLEMQDRRELANARTREPRATGDRSAPRR
jgi:hypothetical protein